MNKLILAAVLMLPVVATAQTTKVIVLQDADATEAKAIADARAQLNERELKLEMHIRDTYIVKSSHTNSLGQTCKQVFSSVHTDCTFTSFKDGWGYGDFLFSDDYKFIVPKPEESHPTTFMTSPAAISDKPTHPHPYYTAHDIHNSMVPPNSQ